MKNKELSFLLFAIAITGRVSKEEEEGSREELQAGHS